MQDVMHQPNMGHTHVRSALNLLCHQSKLGTYPLSPLVHPLVDRGWLVADFHTRRWNCFIIWMQDVEKLRKISTFNNRVNHLTPFKSMWVTNILTACAVWEKYENPLLKHTAAGMTDVRTSAQQPPGMTSNLR